jgi:aspartate kinase
MLVVQKYGGSSVGTLEKIEHVAKKVAKRKASGDSVVVVVSAMSGETDKLISYANHFSKTPSRREMDMLLSSGERVTSSLLAIALKEMGHDAIALTGRQAGIYTDDVHTSARIDDIHGGKILEHIDGGKVVVVAGFQGVTKDGNVATLGRGGSDLSAVAIAGATNADFCEIYSDVDGVYTTDPRIEPNAKKIDKISYEEMLEFASMGAKVLQNRSVELAMKLGVKIRAKSTFVENEGTLITNEEEIMEQPIVSGIALDKNQARITLRDVEDRVGIAASIFEELSKEGINVDMIIQNVGLDNLTNLGFTVPSNELERAKEVIQTINPAKQIDFDDSIVKVSIIGVGMKSHSGVASKAFSTLAKENINIQMISTSEIKLSMAVDKKYGELAVRALHEAYGLDK